MASLAAGTLFLRFLYAHLTLAGHLYLWLPKTKIHVPVRKSAMWSQHRALKTGLFPRVCVLLGGAGHRIFNPCSWESSAFDVQLSPEASISWRSCSRFSWNTVLNLTCLSSLGGTVLASLVVSSQTRNQASHSPDGNDLVSMVWVQEKVRQGNQSWSLQKLANMCL